MEMNITQITIGAVAGGAAVLFLVMIVTLIRHKSRLKIQKDKDLTTKAIGLLMSETNGLFTSYRLGDISFPEFERKVRELVAKLNDEVNENLSMLDSSYVSILGRYTEDKTESLLAIREAISGHAPSSGSVAPAPVRQVAPVSTDEFSDFAASMEMTAASSDALFGGGEQTFVQETPQSAPNIFSASEQTIVTNTMPEPQPVATQQFAQPSAPIQPQPQVQTSQPVQQQQPVGMMDVEATQEFNMSDIMSSAQAAYPPQQQNGDMVSGDDVANKLDSLFG